MSQLHLQRGELGQRSPQPGLVGLIVVCCLPMVVIAITLVTAGGIKAGLLVPAITCGAMIGMMMFIAFREKPPR